MVGVCRLIANHLHLAIFESTPEVRVLPSAGITRLQRSYVPVRTDNIRSPWNNFEAGAIARTVDHARVCPIVFGMEPTDVEWPLAQFQLSRFNKEEIHRLFRTINAAAGDNKLSDSNADEVFNKWWPDLETEVNRILTSAKSPHSKKEVRPQRELIEEMLSLVRNMSGRQEQLEIASQR